MENEQKTEKAVKPSKVVDPIESQQGKSEEKPLEIPVCEKQFQDQRHHLRQKK
jgi:hypothetical protein